MDRRGRVHRARHRDRHRRRLHRDVLGHAGHGAGIADDVRATRRRRVRRADREDPHRAGRYGSRHGLRQRGLALAVRRRFGGLCRGEGDGRQGEGPGGEGARGGGGRHRVRERRISRSPAPIGASVCSSWRRSSPIAASCSTRPARSPAQPGPTAATSARWRSIPTPARSTIEATASVNDVGRVVNPMIVQGPARRRRNAGHRPGALRDAWSTTAIGPAADRRR